MQIYTPGLFYQIQLLSFYEAKNFTTHTLQCKNKNLRNLSPYLVELSAVDVQGARYKQIFVLRSLTEDRCKQ